MNIIHVGAKNFPPAHGGVETVIWSLAEASNGTVSHVLVERPANRPDPRAVPLQRGLLGQLRQVLLLCKASRITLVHLHKETFIPLALLLWARGIPVLLTLHGCAWRLHGRWSFPVRTAFFILDCVACSLLPHVSFVGTLDFEFFSKLLFWRTFHLIPNGVALPPIESPPASQPLPWVYLGRLSPEKNILEMIKAAEAARIHIDLYGPLDEGNKPFASEFRRTIARLRFASWRGALAQCEIPSVLPRYAVFVSLSRSEGMPVAVLEAAACGLYLVLSDIPQHRNLRMPAATYVPLKRIELRPEMALATGKANRERVSEAFTVEHMARAYEKVYQSFSRNDHVGGR